MLSPAEIRRIITDPKIRPQDSPALVSAGNQLMIEPQDLHLQEYFVQLLNRRLKQTAEVEAKDRLYANCPPRNTRLTTEPAIWGGSMVLTGDNLPLPLSKASSGMVIAGLPGSGKTTLAMLLVVQFVLAGALVIVWDMKRTWRRLLRLPALADRMIVLSILDLIWSLLQPTPGTGAQEWANRFTKVFAQAYSRVSAQRILRELIDELLAVCPPGCWPTPQMLIDRLKALQGKSFREKEYVSSVLWTLIDITKHFPGCFEYTSSDFPARLFTQPGRLVVIENNGAPIQHWSFPIYLAHEWISAFRQNNLDANRFDIIQVIEDSTSLLDPARDYESPGGVSLLAQNLDLGREMDIGTMAICHSIGQISPKVLHSLESIWACTLRGDNLSVAQQVLGITREQAEYLRVNPKGTGCALVPTVWPLPVMIRWPPLLEALP